MNGAIKRSGFTLAELLVVITIIGILASILLPVLSIAKDRGRDATCISNLRQWGVTWKIYTDDNNDSFMSGTTSAGWPRGAWVLSFTNGFAKKPALLLCPKATDRRGPGQHETHVSANDGNAVDWGGPTTAYAFPIPDPANSSLPLTASYGLNCWVYNLDTNNIQGRIDALHWRKYSAPPKPSVTPLFLDSMWRGGGPHSDDAAPAFNGDNDVFGPSFPMSGDDMSLFSIARHGKGVNILYFDSSVRNARAKDLWSLPWHVNYHVDTNIVFPGWMD